MKAAELSLWNNKYTDIFDFTPGGKPNYSVKVKQDPNEEVEWVPLK